MMKYVFVGDLHGRIESVKAALDQDGTIIFVGDYLDSYDRSLDDQIDTLLAVLDAIASGKARGLFGNHELSYLVDHHFCSGYSRDTQQEVDRLKSRMLDELETHIQLGPNWLITHAGAHPYVWDGTSPILNINLEDTETRWHWIGSSRGGRNLVGGIWWCDFNDEFEPIPGVNQVFGHSSRGGDGGVRAILKEGTTNYCIDCLEHYPTTFLKLEI